MLGIVGIIALLVALGLSLLVTRLATTVLVLTGLSREAARFQARSAFTGTGFTTREAESVVDHPVRRRVVTALMVVRSAGLVTIVISLILSFGTAAEGARLTRLLWLLGGVAALWVLANNRLADRWLDRLVKRALRRWTDLDVRDYDSLLDLSGDYAVMELQVREGDWIAGRSLSDCDLHEEGVTVLGIRRNDGSYVGVPQSDTTIRAGNVLVLYGRAKGLRELDERRDDAAGDQAHERATEEQAREVERQEQRERETDEGERDA